MLNCTFRLLNLNCLIILQALQRCISPTPVCEHSWSLCLITCCFLLQTHLPNIKVHAYFAPVTPPPSVGGSRQRFCRCCVLLWCKDNDPRPARVLTTLSIACNLTPNLLWPPPQWVPPGTMPAPFRSLKRGRQRTHNIFPRTTFPHLLHRCYNPHAAGLTGGFADACAEANAGCQHIPAPALWTSQRCRKRGVWSHGRGSVHSVEV